MLNRSMGRGLTNRITSPRGKEVGVGLTTLSITTVVTETLTTTSRQQDLGEEGPLDQGYMTQGSESRQEAVMPTPFLTPKRITNIANWSIKTMFQAGKAAQLAQEMENYGILLLGLCETRWKVESPREEKEGTPQKQLATGH